MPNFFDLKTAADLREKLRRDLAKVKGSPLDADVCFNFFVTSEHMLDWTYPKNSKKQKETRQSLVLLRVCSHLANGAKHFELEDKRHDSVDSTNTVVTGYGTAYATPYATVYGGCHSELTVRLKGDAATQLGQSIGVIELAEKVMEFWDNHPLT